MFLGHFAIAFAAKRAAPRASLGVLAAAAQWPDLLWPILLLLGWERVAIAPGDTAFTPLRFESYPISHSLAAVCVWAALGATLYWLGKRDLRASVTIALLVLSHWVLDAVTHRPDLPLSPWSDAVVGLELWRSVPLTVALELGMFALGTWAYLRARPAAGRRAGFWSLAAFLLVIYVLNVFGGAPPGPRAVAWVTLSMWLLVAWAWAADRGRPVR